jgi:hypothetical protein
MSYNSIDPVIQEWAKKHSLPVYTQYKDVEVRSMELVSVNGKRAQIWIDKPLHGLVGLHAWNYKKLRRDWNVSMAKLDSALEQVYQVSMAWIN